MGPKRKEPGHNKAILVGLAKIARDKASAGILSKSAPRMAAVEPLDKAMGTSNARCMDVGVNKPTKTAHKSAPKTKTTRKTASKAMATSHAPVLTTLSAISTDKPTIEVPTATQSPKATDLASETASQLHPQPEPTLLVPIDSTPRFTKRMSLRVAAALAKAQAATTTTSSATIAAKATRDSAEKAAAKLEKLRAAGYDEEPLCSLPAHPDRHPTTNWKNKADPSATVDRSIKYEVMRLLDRRGRPPMVAYLVEWATEDHQFTWQWTWDLKSATHLKAQINKWKAAVSAGKTTLNAVDWQTKHFSGASASSTGRCFVEAFQAALFYQGRAGQVTIGMWNDFTADYPEDIANGAKKADQVAFYRFARDRGVLYDYSAATPNRMNVSVTSPSSFKGVVDNLDVGWYVVHASQHDTEHCFALRVDVGKQHQVVDAFDETKNPPCHLEPLSFLLWINRVFTVRRINATSSPFKRWKGCNKAKCDKVVGSI